MIIKHFYSTFKLIFLVFTLYFSFGCNQNKIIEEEKFVKIYTDIIIAKGTISGTTLSSDTVLQRVLVKHNVSIEDYKATIQYYNQDSERWEKFFAKAIANLEKKRKKSAK